LNIKKEDMSALVYYNHKNRKYVVMEGEFEMKNMISFMENFKKKSRKGAI